MEVDRIWRIDGLDGQANPAWQNSARRRRHFREEIAEGAEESGDSEEESSAEDQASAQDRRSFSVAEDSNPATASPEDGASFRIRI